MITIVIHFSLLLFIQFIIDCVIMILLQFLNFKFYFWILLNKHSHTWYLDIFNAFFPEDSH